MVKWGNIRVLSSLILEIKNILQKNERFSNVFDFAEYALRKELDKLEATQKMNHKTEVEE